MFLTRFFTRTGTAPHLQESSGAFVPNVFIARIGSSMCLVPVLGDGKFNANC